MNPSTVAFMALCCVVALVAKLIRPKLFAPAVIAAAVVSSLVTGVGFYASTMAKTADVEILNGEVTGKEIERVSCSHTYSCNCVETCSTDARGSRSCSTTCSTCTLHPYDNEYHLHTQVGDIEIETIDRQGLRIPPRYASAQLGDPVAVRHRFTNYIRGAEQSLFNSQEEQSVQARFAGHVPAYPATVKDYHYIDRVLVDGVVVPDLAGWNLSLAKALAKLGPAVQANAVIVFTASPDPAYADALRAAWLGGKKNDVILVLGVPDYPAMAWSRVISWTDAAILKETLADDIQHLPAATAEAVIPVFSAHILGQFKRKHMADFEYLKNDLQAPVWALLLVLLLAAGAGVGAYIGVVRQRSF